MLFQHQFQSRRELFGRYFASRVLVRIEFGCFASLQNCFPSIALFIQEEYLKPGLPFDLERQRVSQMSRCNFGDRVEVLRTDFIKVNL